MLGQYLINCCCPHAIMMQVVNNITQFLWFGEIIPSLSQVLRRYDNFSDFIATILNLAFKEIPPG